MAKEIKTVTEERNALKPGLKKKDKTMSEMRLKIIQTASRLFLERGYSHTTIRDISGRLNTSPGHIMFYFPTKEHLLGVIVDKLCEFQSRIIKKATDSGESPLLAVCFEIMTMVAACEDDAVTRDFFASAYAMPVPLEIIRKSESDRAREIFGQYCTSWDDTRYREAETLISGIEYSTLMVTESSAPLDVRISGALNAIMAIYEVPEEQRREVINTALAMDYRTIGKRVLADFVEYLEETNEYAFVELKAKLEALKAEEQKEREEQEKRKKRRKRSKTT